MPRKPRLKLLRARGTPDDVVVALDQALERAQNDETLALGLIEVRREGEIHFHHIGDADGFRHHLVAGCQYLLKRLAADED